MSFTNTNYEAKLSSSMTENWLVQIFKNTNTNILTTNTPDFTFSFSETAYNSINYYPAILNKPSISYSLDLKSFSTKTGSITLNLANINLDGTTLLELLGSDTINGHVNILSQIDHDNTANNALQIFSGKVSSFAYRNNTIILTLISTRPFQNVSVPSSRTSNATNPQYNNRNIPLVYGEYTPNTSFTNGQDVYPCPFLKNDGANFLYIVPQGTTGSEKLEFYDKSMKRFIELTGMTSTNNTIATIDGASILSVPKSMQRQFNMLPDEITQTLVGSGVSLSSGTLAQAFNGNTGNGATFSQSSGFSGDARGVVLQLKMPQATGKITAITLGLSGTFSQTITGSPAGTDGAFFNLATSLSSSFGSTSGDVELVGSSSSGDKVDKTNEALPTSTDIASILDNGTLPNELYLSFKFNASGDGDYSSFNVILNNIFLTITAENDTANEPIASQEFNAGVEKVYLARDITTESFRAHSGHATLSDLNNPVAIHRNLLHDILGVDDYTSDAEIEASGFKDVAELRDSDPTNVDSTSTVHWQTRLNVQESLNLESILQELQYEGCFFFEFSPQAQQTSITGVHPLRYFTIRDNPTANVALSQNDISDYELSITPAQDLETNILINYKKHPAENQFLKQASYELDDHDVIFDDVKEQKQEINLNHLFDAVETNGTERNKSWLNFRTKLFGNYKTIVKSTLVNPEKYGMLQVGDFIDFSSITFADLGTPFSEISDTFDSFVAMPTNLFKESWSGKKFIITNLKRQVGKVSIITREI